MTISHYTEHRDGVHGRNRVVIDISRARAWLGAVAALVAIAGSAATGVLATAHAVVPPIATAAVRPEIDRLAVVDSRLEAMISKVERDGAARDAENMQALRQQMTDLQTQLRETTRVTSDLLLQLARERRR